MQGRRGGRVTCKYVSFLIYNLLEIYIYIYGFHNNHFKKYFVWLGPMAHIWSPTVLEAKVGRPQAQDLPRLHNKSPVKLKEQAPVLKKIL